GVLRGLGAGGRRSCHRARWRLRGPGLRSAVRCRRRRPSLESRCRVARTARSGGRRRGTGPVPRLSEQELRELSSRAERRAGLARGVLRLGAGGPGPATPVELGLGVEVGEEGLEAGQLGPHLVSEAVVDLDGLGQDLALALRRTAGPELPTQLTEAALGG